MGTSLFTAFGMTKTGIEPTTSQPQGGHAATMPLSWAALVTGQVNAQEGKATGSGLMQEEFGW